MEVHCKNKIDFQFTIALTVIIGIILKTKNQEY